MTYNWQLPDWPHFSYDSSKVQPLVMEFAKKTGRLEGALKSITEVNRNQILLDVLIDEAIKTSEIEGEFLQRSDVKSSLKNQLGLNLQNEKVKDLRARGISELIVQIQQTFHNKLTQKELLNWHKLLMQGTLSRIKVGAYRTDSEPMQVVSGPIGKWKVHFEAPPAKIIPKEMKRFIKWFNDTAPGQCQDIYPGAIRSALIHLYFESLHPFDDGNGRLGRFLSEKALAQHQGHPGLFSLSKAIESQKQNYYKALEKAQKSNEVTDWVLYFLQTLIKAQDDVENLIDYILVKARFFERFQDQLNSRQLKVVQRMFKEGPRGFAGGMSAKKYMKIAKTSKSTATRDLQELVGMGVLAPIGKGRSTQYDLNLANI